ncbi:MAG: SulP family inorganic anion transporter [Betaproteobacteria bacterium]|nr:SulP family inorganic anion transporter [Betaproteobacteria bacterium]
MITFVQRHKGDLFGGLTAAIVALPLALAFGVASGAGALAGLWGAILVGLFAALLGGTRHQVSGPTGPMTVVMALIITQLGGNLAAAFTVVVLAGGIQILFGMLGIGRYVKLVPQPVVSGFMSGIGFIIIILQLAHALGHAPPPGEIVEKLAALPALAASPNLQALALCAICLGIMSFTPKKIAARVPPPLIAILAGTLAGVLVFPAAPVIGDIPTGLPAPTMPSIALAELPAILRFALILAFLGSIDSLLTSLVADSVTRTHHDSNRELIGQGVGNIAAGLFGGIAGAGATMRTLVNIRAGATSRLSGAIHAVVLLALVLGFGGAASHIPLAVLAGILLKVGYDIIDWPYLKRILVVPRAGVVIMLTTLLMTVFVDLMTAVAVGIVMASLLFVARMAEAQMQTAKMAFNSEHAADLAPEEAAILDGAGGRIVLMHVEGPLCFGSARDISRLMQASAEKDALVVDFSDVPFVDTSASMALEETILALRELGDAVILFGVRERVRETLGKAGVLRHLEGRQVAATRLEALRAARDHISGAAARS